MTAASPTIQRSGVDSGANDPVATLCAEDFLLDPEAFVERCIAVYATANRTVGPGERTALVEAIRAGRPRVEVADAVRRLYKGAAEVDRLPSINGIGRQYSTFVDVPLLERFAPDDDEAFVRQLYQQMLGRHPTTVDMKEALFDLRHGLDRRAFIDRLAARWPGVVLSTQPVDDEAGLSLAADGKLCFRLIEPRRDNGWSIPPAVWLQPVPTVDGALQVRQGMICHGPRRSFPAGSWQAVIDVIQPSNAVLTIDVVANVGLDILVETTVIGSASFAMPFEIASWHHFIEARLQLSKAAPRESWLKLRTFMLKQR